MATEKDLRDRVLLLLCSRAAGKVEFTLDGVYFHGAYFGLIAMAITLKTAGFNGIGFKLGGVDPGSDAGYSPSKDAFKVSDATYGTTEFQRHALVHEAVHAYLDMAKSSKTALTDEALAYVGGLLFHLHDTTSAGGTPAAPGWAASGPFATAYKIASGLITSGTTAVSAADAQAMRDAVAASATYASLKADPTIQYGNNGVW
ncbi:MAG: hypothetical protein ACRC33_15740 [Gemmataceae bacterium]